MRTLTVNLNNNSQLSTRKQAELLFMVYVARNELTKMLSTVSLIPSKNTVWNVPVPALGPASADLSANRAASSTWGKLFLTSHFLEKNFLPFSALSITLCLPCQGTCPLTPKLEESENSNQIEAQVRTPQVTNDYCPPSVPNGKTP